MSRTNGIFGAGAYLTVNKFYATISTPNFLSGKRVAETDNDGYTEGTDKLHIYAGAGYTFDFGENFELTPALMARFVEATPASVDISATVNMYKMVEAGVAYRWDESVSFLALIRAADWLQFGYAYEAATEDNLNGISGGTHELMLQFRFD